jgi:hypothetical protein
MTPLSSSEQKPQTLQASRAQTVSTQSVSQKAAFSPIGPYDSQATASKYQCATQTSVGESPLSPE